jgi:hypothetical protein
MEKYWSLFEMGQAVYSDSYKIQHRKKLEAVLHKGGKCIRCGYSSSIDALDFHHVDPSDKEMGWTRMRGLKMQTIEKELKKCICVCNRCHREIHSIIGLIASIEKRRLELK